MRSSRTSNVKAKELAKKYTAKRNAEKSAQPAQSSQQTSNIAQVSQQQTTPAQAGIVGAGPRANNPPNADGRIVSRDVAGDEIKRDAQGEFDLKQVTGDSSSETPAPRGISEQFLRGLLTPTEQFIQMPKDVIEGVRAEDQVMKETGLDLLITPVAKPFVTAQARGVTNKEWYSPISLITDDIARSIGLPDNNSLPTFLQNDGDDKRDFVTGMGDNLVAAGDVLGHETTYHGEDSIGAGFEHSAERFEEAPGHYIGTAIGELPYWFIGVGQVSAAAKVSVTAARYTAKTGKIANPRLLAKAYKNEQTTKKLAAEVNRENKLSLTDPTGKLKTKKPIVKAIQTLRAAYGVQRHLIEKDMLKKKAELKILDDAAKSGRYVDAAKQQKLKNFIKQSNIDISTQDRVSKKLDAFKEQINKVDNAVDAEEITNQRIILNDMVKMDLMPKMDDFNRSYSRAVEEANVNPRIKKLADKGVSLNKAIKLKFNPIVKTWGDIDSPERIKSLAMMEQIEYRRKSGYYNTATNKRGDSADVLSDAEKGQVRGVMGVLRYEKDLLHGALDSAVNSRFSTIGRRRARLEEVVESVSENVAGFRLFDSDQFSSAQKYVTGKRKELEEQNINLNKNTSPETKKLLKDKKTFETDYEIKLLKLEDQKSLLLEIMETGMYEVPGGRVPGNVSLKGKKTKSKVDDAFDNSNVKFEEGKTEKENYQSRFVNADVQKIIETKTMIDSINLEIKNLKSEINTNPGYIDTIKRIDTISDKNQKDVVSDIAKNKKEIAYLKEIEENPHKNVWWYTNPKTVGTTKSTYLFDLGAIEKVVPSIKEAWADDLTIIQAVRPSVSAQYDKGGIIVGQVQTSTLIGKTKNISTDPSDFARTAAENTLSGEASGMQFWVRDIAKKDADKQFGKKYTEDGSLINSPVYEGPTKTKLKWRTIKGRRVAIPKKAKTVTSIEFYKADDYLQSAGQVHGTSALYVLPRGNTETWKNEMQMFREKHFLEDYSGTDLPYLAFGGKETGNFVILQEKKFPAKSTPTTEIQVRSDADMLQAEKFIQKGELVENRKIAQNRYDVNWQQERQDSIRQAMESTTSEGKTSQQYVNEIALLGREREELDTKIASIKERQARWKELGVKEVGDPRGTVFSMPLSALVKARNAERESNYSTKFVDTQTGKNYFEKNGRTFEILDDDFDITRVIDAETVQLPSGVSYDKAPGFPRHTDRYQMGSAIDEWGNTTDMGYTTLGGTWIAKGENLFQKKGEKPDPLLRATKSESEVTDAVRGFWMGLENDQYIPGSVYAEPPSAGGMGLGRDGPLHDKLINISNRDDWAGKLRELDATERVKLYKGSKLGKEILNQEKKLIDEKQYTQHSLDGKPNVIESVNPNDGGILQSSKRGFVWKNHYFGGGIVRHAYSNVKIKTRKKILKGTEKVASLIDSDRLQKVRGRWDESEMQPVHSPSRSMQIYEDHTLLIGMGSSQQRTAGFRTMFGAGDDARVTAGQIPGGVNVYPMYQFDTPFHLIKDKKIASLARAEERNSAQRANMLKSQKMDTFDKMESEAIRLSGHAVEESLDATKKEIMQDGATGAYKQFRENVVKLYYKKIGTYGTKDDLNITEIRQKAASNEYDQIVRHIKDKNLVRMPRKTVGRKKRQNIITPDEIGKKYLPELTVDQGGIVAPKSFLKNYFPRIWGKASGTKPKDVDFRNPSASKLDEIKEKISEKKDVTVENADPRTLFAVVKALDDLKSKQGGKLVGTQEKLYNKLKGRNVTAEEFALLNKEMQVNDNYTGFVEFADGRKIKFTGTSFDDVILKQFTPGIDKIRVVRDNTPPMSSVANSPFVNIKKERNTNSLTDSQFEESIKAIVFEDAGIKTTDNLETSHSLAPSAQQILDYNSAVKSFIGPKKSSHSGFTSSLTKSVGANYIGAPNVVQQAVHKINTARNSWENVTEKAASRVNPVNQDNVTGAMTGQKGRSDPNPMQDPPSFLGGLESMFMGGENQNPFPQAHAEKSRLESMSDTVTSSFDSITKGGIKIGANTKQEVKMSDSPTGGMLGVNQNLIPQQSMKDSISTGVAGIPGFAMVVPQISSTLTAGTSRLVPTTAEAANWQATVTTTGLTSMSMFNQMLNARLKEGSILRQETSFNPRVTPSSFNRVVSPPMTPRVIPGPLPVIPLSPYGRPLQRRQQKKYKKKSAKAYWQTPQNWYEPYYWGGQDQMGSGYTIFKGKEPAKVRKYDQKWFGLDLGNIW